MGFLKKTKCLVKTVKKVLFEKVASTYKSSGLNGKLPKMTKCVYIYNNNNYFMLIINDALNKRVCKKVFGFNISLFKKCYSQYFHNKFSQYCKLSLLKYILFFQYIY